MNPFIKLAMGAVLLGVGFVVSMGAQRELIAKWSDNCEDCNDEPTNPVEDAGEVAADVEDAE